jgi:tRNA 2-thiouridine synthesizing protein E
MINVKVYMRVTREPLKRTDVVLHRDVDRAPTAPLSTDRLGMARFDLPPGTGKVFVAGIERYHGRLDGDIDIGLWSLTQAGGDDAGAPGVFPSGSNAYPNMSTRTVQAGGREILTDSEGYIVNPAEWSEAFARALAQNDHLALTGEHWEVIRYLREQYAAHGRQASVRDTIRHFRQIWDDARATNRYLHSLFPHGGPQKQGNRLAGLLRTKGEH